MGNNKVDLSIVIPLYNEEESIPELYQQIKAQTKKYTYQIIFIDDGSTDNSYSELLKIKKSDKNINIIKFKKNFGKSDALDAGFKYSKGQYIITMDADLQDEPAEIPNLIQSIKSSKLDIISGWKFKRNDPLSKTIPSKIFNYIIRVFTGIKLHDINCGLKIYKRPAIKDLHLYGSMHRFIPVILALQGFKSGEIKVKHNPRKYGVSKFGTRRFIIGLLDFFTILFISKFFRKPLHFFGTLAIFFLLLGAIAVSYIIYLKIVFGNIQSRMPLLNLGVLSLIVGGQFFSIGLIGELIVSNYLYKNNYIIEELL